MNRAKSLGPLVVFLTVFYLVDIARLYIEHNWFIEIDRLFTWVAPTLLFILLWEKKNPISYLKLKGNVGIGISVGLFIGAIPSYQILTQYLSNIRYQGSFGNPR